MDKGRMTEELSFQQSIEASSQIIEKIDGNIVSEADAMQSLRSLLGSVESARGFFVSLLTGDWTFGNILPDVIVDACRQSGDIAEKVLTKNLVMSTCMQVHHLRCGNQENAEGSGQVTRRSIFLINQLRTDSLKSLLEAMREAITIKIESSDTSADNEYVSFLTRWKYDSEQLAAAYDRITDVLASAFSRDA